MKVDFRFKDVDFSQSIANHCQERLEKIQRFLFQPAEVKITCYIEGRNHCVEVYMHGSHRDYCASAQSASIPAAVDAAFAKLSKQLQKKKRKVQRHKFRDASAAGRLDQVTEELESPEAYPLRRAA